MGLKKKWVQYIYELEFLEKLTTKKPNVLEHPCNFTHLPLNYSFFSCLQIILVLFQFINFSMEYFDSFTEFGVSQYPLTFSVFNATFENFVRRTFIKKRVSKRIWTFIL